MLLRPCARCCLLESGEFSEGMVKSELVEDECRWFVSGRSRGGENGLVWSGLRDCSMVSTTEEPV